MDCVKLLFDKAESSAVVSVFAKRENSYTFYCEMLANGFHHSAKAIFLKMN